MHEFAVEIHASFTVSSLYHIAISTGIFTRLLTAKYSITLKIHAFITKMHRDSHEINAFINKVARISRDYITDPLGIKKRFSIYYILDFVVVPTNNEDEMLSFNMNQPRNYLR